MLQMARLRKDLQFNNLMSSIIEVLKGVASAEYFHLQRRRKSFSEFDGYLKDFFQMASLGDFQHPFLGAPSSPNNIVLITSDTGFLGKLNIAVVDSALDQYRTGDLLTVVGKQGARYIEEQSKEFKFFPGIDDNILYSEVIRLRDYIISKFLDKKLGGTVIIYPHLVSFSVQKTQQLQLLPCKFLFQQEESASGVKTEVSAAEFFKLSHEEETIIEPSLKRMVEYLVKIWIGQLVYLVFWESKLSEWAARVMHLEESFTEIKNQDRKLKFQYFRLLHQISDKNIREVFASRLALEKSEVIL